MKKFGFGRKTNEGDDADRKALFGRKKVSNASSSENPYALQGANDPYADGVGRTKSTTPYQKARTELSGGQRPGGGDAYPGPNRGDSSRGGTPASAFGAERHGSGGGYGSNRYNSPASAAARGPGGYGGFGRVNDDTPDQNRDALLSRAEERFAQKQASGPAPGHYAPSGSADGSYGGYGEPRELTAEEQEAAEYQAILAEKRQFQKESASSVSRSVQMARQANEVGQATLARLGAQGERLQNTEKNLDLADNQNKIAQDRAAELKSLNRSMFSVHVNNPFTSKQRKKRADEEVMNLHRSERDQREATRREGFQANQRMESAFTEIDHARNRARPQARKKDYGKFNLDDEEGADELEDQIDDGLDELENQVSMMNMVGRAIGKEVDNQNRQIDRIMNKSDAVDDATRMNRERLARIK